MNAACAATDFISTNSSPVRSSFPPRPKVFINHSLGSPVLFSTTTMNVPSADSETACDERGNKASEKKWPNSRLPKPEPPKEEIVVEEKKKEVDPPLKKCPQLGIAKWV